MHPQDPDRFWLSFANASSSASNMVFTTDGGSSWQDPGLNPADNGYLDYHVSLSGENGDLYFTFPSGTEGIKVRRFIDPATSNEDRGPLIILPNTTSHHRSSGMIDGNSRLWVFTRLGDDASENVRYAYSDDHGTSWTYDVAVATGAPNVRIGSMPFVDGRACLVILHLQDPRGYEYYLWNGTSFVPPTDHIIWAEDMGYDRAFTHNTVGDNFHLIFGRGNELRHVWKQHDAGAGQWQTSVILSSSTTNGIDMLPISAVRGDNLYLFYCLRDNDSSDTSTIYGRVWSQSDKSWGPEYAISDASTNYNLHPNTCRQVPLASTYIPVFWIAGADGSQIVFNKVAIGPTESTNQQSWGETKALYR